MSILLLRLAGPMQSWGTQSRFTERDTGREPSKSGVLGLICAAMGRRREEPVDDLVGLRMGVRVDQEGEMERDFHTARNCYRADGSGLKNNVSNRYYLADACFLVALEGDRTLLERIQKAVKGPHWQIYLGRKSFLPSLPVWIKDGLIEDRSIIDLFGEIPCWRLKKGDEVEGGVELRYVIETDYGEHDAVVKDTPKDSFRTREFLPRYIRRGFISLPPEKIKEVHLCLSLN